MCAELIYVVFAVFGLFIVDNFSTSLAVVICAFLIYFYIQFFVKDFDKDRFIAFLIIKTWGGLFNIFRLWKYLFVIFKNIFFSPEKNVKASDESNCQYCGETACLEKEIDVIVFNVSQYYLHSWYDRVGNNEEFILHLNSIIKDALLKLCSEVIKINRKRISYIILQIYFHFFIHFIDAKKKAAVFKVENFEMKHWATQDSMTEWCYLQSLMSSLIDNFGPAGHENSLHSKHSPILHNFIVEILTEHILLPLSNLLSDPSQLNSWLLKILETYIQVDGSIEDSLLDTENFNSVSNEDYNLGPKIVLDGKDSSFDSSEIKSKPVLSEHTLSVPYKSYCASNDTAEYEINDSINNLSELHTKADSEFLSPLMSSGVRSSSNINLFDNDFLDVRTSSSEACSPVSCDTSTIKRSKSADYIRQMPQLRALNMRDYNIVMQDDSNKMFVALKSDLNPSGFIEQAEEAFEVPSLFSDVRISDTQQQSEAGFLPYTLYCIQYSGVFHDTGRSSEKPHFIKQEISIKRRFREFLALQSRLEDNPTLKNALKGIKGPSKWSSTILPSPLPFSNMDKKNIAERKSFLENYLKELCSRGPIVQSSELQEFLAYGGDATVAFVKKAADITVPRIDKMFVRGVKGAIDMFRTALPNTAVEGGCSSEVSSTSLKSSYEETLPDHRFPEHILEYSSREPEIRGLLKHVINKISSIPQFENIEGYRNSDYYSQRASLLRSLHKLKVEKCCNCYESWNINDETFLLEENLFGNILIDIMIESLKLSQINSSHLFSVMKLIFPPSIDRYFSSFLDEFSEYHLAVFLHILHKTLWPSESISNDKENTEVTSKCSSYSKLQMLLKEAVASSNVTMNVSWVQQLCLERIYLFLSSIQHQKLNRCLLFHIFDVVIDTVCSSDN